MKKLFPMILLALLLLSGCAQGEAETVVVTPVPTVAPTPEPFSLTVNSGDAWGDYGYVHFLCEQGGSYSFTAVDSDGIGWKVYLLQSEFTDAERFIPHANEVALEGDGTLEIAQGEYVYIYCEANSWTGIEARDGAKLEVLEVK